MDDNDDIPTYQLHVVEMDARGLAGMQPSEIRMQLGMIYRSAGIKVEQMVVMDRDMFAGLVRRFNYVAEDLDIDTSPQ